MNDSSAHRQVARKAIVLLKNEGGLLPLSPSLKKVAVVRGFQRIRLRAGESRVLEFVLPSEGLPKSALDVSVGGGQPLRGTPVVRASLPAAAR